MDNNGQMPPFQPMQGIPTVGGGGTNGNMMNPGNMSAGGMGAGGMGPNGAGRLYTAEQVEKMMEPKKDVSGLIKTVVIIVLSLVAATFIGLFVWMFVQFNTVQDDINKQIDTAVASAKDSQASQDTIKCQKEKENPYTEFTGPVDYGELNFKFPKTWSVYIANDASSGGDFNAYLNPVSVNNVSDKNSLYALRVTIRNKAFDDVVAEYQKYMERKDSNLNMEAITVNDGAANRYTGKIPNTEFNGIIVIFKIRDKTAILQTDSVLFEQDFNDIVNSITFNA